jgi:acyl-CoA synthetase (AMP-forming)/AMP-acid ligase II
MIIRRGLNIYPGVLEGRVREITAGDGRRLVADCALVGLWDEAAGDEIAVLCYVEGQGAMSDPAKVEREICAALGAGVEPDAFLRYESLPVTGRQNKVDRVELRSRACRRLAVSRGWEHLQERPPGHRT